MAVLITSDDATFNAELICDTLVQNGGDLKIVNFAQLSGGTSGEPVVVVDAGGELNLNGDTEADEVRVTVDDGLLTVTNATLQPPAGLVDSPEGAVVAGAQPAISGLTVNFQDKTFVDGSQGPEASWLWTFGDSDTSTEQNPSHTYAEGGTYSVSLTVTTSGGATSDWNGSVTVS